MRRFRNAVLMFGGLPLLAATHAVAAQSSASSRAPSPATPLAHLAALTIPPPTVGTCMPVRASAARDGRSRDLRGHRLVMTSRAPGGRREMSAYTDTTGEVRRYVEMTDRTIARGTGAGENIVAALASDGRVSGVIVRTTVVMKAPPPGRLDSAGLRVMREGATSTGASTALDARQQAQVRAAAAWLIRRCPA